LREKSYRRREIVVVLLKRAANSHFVAR
jgi:hypothetical protein